MNKYVLDKRKSIIKLNTDTEGDLIIINNNDLNNYFERKKKFLEEMENAKRTEKVCSDCDLKCGCTPNY